MTTDNPQKAGATGTGETDTGSEPSTDETAPAADERIERLESANRQLREQIDYLEETITDVHKSVIELKDGTENSRETAGAFEAGTEEPRLVTSGGQPTKIVGIQPDDDGIGVLGEATGDGATVGVQGTVESFEGYGLYTPDDAKVDGELETTEIDSDGSDFRLETSHGTDEIPGNIVMGHQDNAAWANGAIVAGGGSSGSDEMNFAAGEFPTVVGGRGNQILTAEENYDTILGGRNNVMADDGEHDPLYSTIAGGLNNEVKDADYTFVAGRNATAEHDGAMVFGDSSTAEITSGSEDEARFQGDLATNGELRTNADASSSVSYLRFRDQTRSSGPRMFHSDVGYIAVRGEEYFDVDMDLEINRDGTEQRTGGPVVKASIASDASINAAVNVETVLWVDSGSYYAVELADIEYSDDEYMAIVVPRDLVDYPTVSLSSTDQDNLKVEFSTDDQAPFHLVVWEAPSGIQTTGIDSESTADDESRN